MNTKRILMSFTTASSRTHKSVVSQLYLQTKLNFQVQAAYGAFFIISVELVDTS